MPHSALISVYRFVSYRFVSYPWHCSLERFKRPPFQGINCWPEGPPLPSTHHSIPLHSFCGGVQLNYCTQCTNTNTLGRSHKYEIFSTTQEGILPGDAAPKSVQHHFGQQPHSPHLFHLARIPLFLLSICIHLFLLAAGHLFWAISLGRLLPFYGLFLGIECKYWHKFRAFAVTAAAAAERDG